MRWIALLAAAALAGCSTTQVYSNLAPGQAAPVNTTGVVQVYYSYPTRPYEVLGVVSAKRYKPGWSDPTVADALPQLKTGAQQLGAHAIVVRSSQSHNTRITTVEAEAIRFIDQPAAAGAQQAPQQQGAPCESCKKIKPPG